ncbi:MAG: hypothetical protein R2825_18870 [Saprospiraceae bacterium]
MINFTKLLLSLLFFASLHSCIESVEDIIEEPTLQGTWKAVSLEGNMEAHYVYNGDSTNITASIVGDDLDYEVTFDDSTFMTNGSYTVTYTYTLNGDVFPPTTHSATNVNGDGNYMIEGDSIITIDGVLYELDINGIDLNALGSEQNAEYEINADGTLTVIQNTEIESDQPGVTGSATVSSRSVWEKQ